MSADKEQNRRDSRKLKLSEVLEKAMDVHISGLYYKVTSSSWEGHHPSSL